MNFLPTIKVQLNRNHMQVVQMFHNRIFVGAVPEWASGGVVVSHIAHCTASDFKWDNDKGVRVFAGPFALCQQ